MNDVPIRRSSLVCGVLTHRGDDDPVAKFQCPDSQRRKEMRMAAHGFHYSAITRIGVANADESMIASGSARGDSCLIDNTAQGGSHDEHRVAPCQRADARGIG